MIHMNPVQHMLARIGYPEKSINEIEQELDTLFSEIDFNKFKHSASSAKDAAALIASLKELMLLLENKGFYRPDFPAGLIKLLVNGLNIKNEDIFALIDRAGIPHEKKRKEQEFLASCAAITQLGYILMRCLVSEVKAASSGPHVFLIIEGFSHDSMIFVDFSIDSIKEIDKGRYGMKDNSCFLKHTAGLDKETAELLTEYYSFFQVTCDIGMSHCIHNNLGIAYEGLGMYEKAIEELHEAQKLDPGYIEVHNNLAVCYDKMGMMKEAVSELCEALRLNPEYAQAHSNLGNIYIKLGNYEEAMRELMEALRLKPDDPAAHNNLGHVYALIDKNDEAIKQFEEALMADPDYAPAHNNLANIYAGSDRHEEAIKEFQKALELDPEFPEAYHGIGSVYYDIGSFDRAAGAWAMAVHLEPRLLECVPDKLLLKVRQGVSRLR